MKPNIRKLWQLLTGRFRLGDWSLHGPAHWKRVESAGLELVEAMHADQQAGVLAVRLFAVFHDAERQNETFDPAHGAGGAALVEQMHGEHFELSPDRLSLLMFACRHHHEGMISKDPTIGACWDADRLNLPRVGIRPVSRLMSTAEGRRRADAR